MLHMQVVHPPVGMEEHAVVQLTMFTTVTVPVGTKETTARTEVHMHACMHAAIGP